MDFILEDLDWKKILLRRYKNYRLDEQELVVLFLINELNRGAPHLISVDELESYTTMSAQRIDSILSRLIELKYVALSEEDASISIMPIKQKVYSDTIKDIKLEETSRDFSKARDQAESIYGHVEQAIGRQISSIEYDTICNWFKTGANLELIDEAITKAKAKRGNPSVASIDKQLLILQKAKELASSDSLTKEQIEILKHDIYKNS